jgi:RNA polymerase sigma factor (sigma-70 family)
MKVELADDPVKTYEERSDHKDLRFILTKLRDDYRDVLIHRFINGMTPQEVSTVMNRSEEAIRVLQHRALKATKKLLTNGDRHG